MADFTFNDPDDAPNWLWIDGQLDPIQENLHELVDSFRRIMPALDAVARKPRLWRPEDEEAIQHFISRILTNYENIPKPLRTEDGEYWEDPGIKCEEDAWADTGERLGVISHEIECLKDGFTAVAQVLELLKVGVPDETS